MKMNDLRIQILSVPHREKLIAEVQYQHHIIAEINNDNDELEIEVFSYDDYSITLSLDKFIQILNEAKEQLLSFE
ncbi:MAG: hypothetical protein QM654_18125 [Dysgonamonadaceae bacterium]